MSAEGAREHFHTLDREQQAAAVRRLATEGMSEHGIAGATGLSVLQVRRVLAEQEPGGSFDGFPVA